MDNRYTPNSEEVKTAWCMLTHADESFDRWLAEVKAQAWEEGYISGTVDTHRNEVSKGNPYRQGEEQ